MKYLALIAALAMSACATSNQPVASDYDESSVTISSTAGSLINRRELSPEITAEAERLCGLTGKRAKFIGSHPAFGPDPTLTAMMGVPVHPNEFEFACLP